MTVVLERLRRDRSTVGPTPQDVFVCVGVAVVVTIVLWLLS